MPNQPATSGHFDSSDRSFAGSIKIVKLLLTPLSSQRRRNGFNAYLTVEEARHSGRLDAYDYCVDVSMLVQSDRIKFFAMN